MSVRGAVFVTIAFAFAFSAALMFVAVFHPVPKRPTAIAKADQLPHIRIIPIAKSPQIQLEPPSPPSPVQPPQPQQAQAAAAPPVPPRPEPQSVPEPEVRHRDVCAKYGGHRVDYRRGWRCVYPRGRR